MDVLILELMEVIRHEVAVFEKLLDCMGREQKALVGHDVTAVENTVDEQADLLKRSKHLETIRRGVVKRISSRLSEDAKTLTLRRLIDRLEGPEADQLGEMRDTMVSLQEKIQRTNRHNAMLIRQSMKYVDKSLQLLTGSGPESGVYGNTGKVAGGKPKVKGVVNQVA